jgi:TPR repeat protein
MPLPSTIWDRCTTKDEVFPGCDKTAVKWYRLAGEQVHAKIQTNLGAKHASRMGAPKDYVYADAGKHRCDERK